MSATRPLTADERRQFRALHPDQPIPVGHLTAQQRTQYLSVSLKDVKAQGNDGKGGQSSLAGRNIVQRPASSFSGQKHQVPQFDNNK